MKHILFGGLAGEGGWIIRPIWWRWAIDGEACNIGFAHGGYSMVIDLREVEL